MTLRCLIVDDSRWFLCAARHLLESQGIAVVGVASNSAVALRRAAELRPDITLVDILISTRAEQDYAELIAANPAVGFLSKTAISASAIQDLLDSHPESNCDDSVSGPQET